MLNESHQACVDLILICGPPGIGKSTLLSNLLNTFRFKSLNSKVWALSFDKIIDKSLEDILINHKLNISSREWKTARGIVSALTSTLIDFLQSFTCTLTFAQLQDFYDSKLDKCLNDSNYFNVLKKNYLGLLKEQFNFESTPARYFIILDDIFYYESMRSVYYRLACHQDKVNYFSYCLKAHTLEFLINRNRSRPADEQLEDRVVESIFNKFDHPDRVGWEREFSHVQMSSYSTSLDHEIVVDIILNGLERFKVFKLTNQTKELVLRKNTKSVLHESDLTLRKLINTKLREVSVDQKAYQAMQLNQIKANILSRLRHLNDNQNIELFFNLHDSLLNTDLSCFENQLKLCLFTC